MNQKSPIPDLLTEGLDFEALADEFMSLLDGAPMPPVAYGFINKDDLLTTWLVREVTLQEEVSRPYRLLLTLVTESHDVDVTAMLGANCELTIDRQDVARVVRGVACTVESSGSDADRLTIRVELVPALALLADRIDSRVWQACSVVDVVRDVLERELSAYSRTLDTTRLTRSYPVREYIVQYQESDFDFVNRLLEQEGITYSFDQEQGEFELLVLEDSTDNSREVLTINDNPVLYVIPDHSDLAGFESIQQFVFARELTSTAFYQRIFDWMTPTTPIEVFGDGADERGRVREVYHHGRFVEADPAPRSARLLLDRTWRGTLASGSSNVTGLTPGVRFAVFDPRRPQLTQSYVLRRVVHEGSCPEVVLESSSDQPRYQNHFECQLFVPNEPLRPLLRTHKPRIYGPQTAIVTGPAGEEIHTDEHGRVKVRFDWDRLQGLRDDTSMWIRVAQNWAGPGFGTFFLPRIGMEVVVEYLEGDPDKPLVVGCAYNGANAISVGVPANKTQSTIRTRSSPASEGYNELRFEDAAGCEEVFLRGQRNLREVVNNCHSTQVGVNQSVTVGVNQSTSVGANQSTSVGANQSTSVDANQSNSVGGNQSESVEGDQCMTVGKTRSKHVIGDETNTLDANRKTTIAGDESLAVSGTTHTTSDGDYDVVCQANSTLWSLTRIKLSQNDEATVEMSGGSMSTRTKSTYGVVATEQAKIESTTADVLIKGSTTVQLEQGGGKLTMTGSVATLTASNIKLSVGDTFVEITSSSVKIKGSSVDVTADGIATIKASVIKLNT